MKFCTRCNEYIAKWKFEGHAEDLSGTAIVQNGDFDKLKVVDYDTVPETFICGNCTAEYTAEEWENLKRKEKDK